MQSITPHSFLLLSYECNLFMETMIICRNVFLCVSRACLGKMTVFTMKVSVFTIKWLNKGRLSYRLTKSSFVFFCRRPIGLASWVGTLNLGDSQSLPENIVTWMPRGRYSIYIVVRKTLFVRF
eukprot:COSAG06_NODE_496_length_15043_cov_8.883565_7_plen_123_part_00